MALPILRSLLLTSALGGAALGAGLATGGGSSTARVRYGRDIRPLLSDRCFKCHGADGASREAELRLDVRDAAVAIRTSKSHPPRAAVVPGKPEESELWRRVTAADSADAMPPAESHKSRLTAAELSLVRRWIEDGAEYEPHWAFTPPTRPDVPQVRQSQWARNAVDQFVLSRLEQEGIAPSAEEARGPWLRRLFLDLTGLPPTPEELDAFEADRRPDAHERWVDKLLSEEPYRTRVAERLATPWLDQARYADTSGIHMDAGRQIWPWRDWVLRALRDNMPFDQFVVEQIAGDLLPNATMDQRVATGFHRNHVTSDEGGAIDEEYRVEYAVDRVATTGSVFLGLTLGCARCHDHKYDPITQKDFYQLFAFFNSIEEPGIYSQEPNANRALEPFLRVPSSEQLAERERLERKLTEAKAELSQPIPEEEEQRMAFLGNLVRDGGMQWAVLEPREAKAEGGAVLTVQPDGSVLASGKNPPKDVHHYTLKTTASALSVIALEAMADATLPGGQIGRAFNGNAVLSRIEVEAAPAGAPDRRVPVPLSWAWADYEQTDVNGRAINVLDGSGDRGWAVGAHQKPGPRVLLLLAQEPFGFEGGTEIFVTLRYESIWSEHTLGRVRFSASPLAEAARARLPVAASEWWRVGPLPGEVSTIFGKRFGPEESPTLDLQRNFGFGNQYWRAALGFPDGKVNDLDGGVNVHYLGRRLFAPTPRKLPLSLGSDDGIRVFVNGTEVLQHDVPRPAAPDQEKLTVDLRAGLNTVVLKIVNTGGQAGFYWKSQPDASELAGPLAAAVLPSERRHAGLEAALAREWKLRFSPGYRARSEAVAAIEKSVAELERTIPLTMVMKELAKPRETFVLKRGHYSMPDKERPVARQVPDALGALPAEAPRDRLGLARWLVSPQNPLLARVTVNRLWEFVFGAGLVRTTEDFGLQGEWPSHPELLDWLAVELRESGWNLRAMLSMLVKSATYRQSARVREDALARDPDGRLLAWMPRRRLGAEQIRDYALFVSGLLVEKFGGPSVKPYQPPGLWEEVAMVQSNTRSYQRGAGEALYRRSLYTYWKRACPPPSMLTLDAPTREFCTIRRSATNTPLQALVLWNDEQMVEAARALAWRVLQEPLEAPTDTERIGRLFRRCAGRAPAPAERDALAAALAAFLDRYRKSPADAEKLLSVGAAPLPAEADRSVLAAWTMLANAVLASDVVITKS